MNCLEILPNFTVLAERNETYTDHVHGVLGFFCEVISTGEHVDTYRLTRESVWGGLNATRESEIDFICMLRTYVSREIPLNVVSELETMVKRFDVVWLLGTDALLVKDNSLLEEIKHCAALSGCLKGIHGNVVFFMNISVGVLQGIFQREFGYPIQYRVASIRDFIISDGFKHYAIKATSRFEALKSLYGMHPFLHEEDLKYRMGVTKKVSVKEIDLYIQFLLDSPKRGACVFKVQLVPIQSVVSPTIL